MQGNLNVQTENIFPVIKKFLYSDHEIFLRELVSNAIDATQKLKALASRGELQGDTGDLTVEVEVDSKNLAETRDRMDEARQRRAAQAAEAGEESPRPGAGELLDRAKGGIASIAAIRSGLGAPCRALAPAMSEAPAASAAAAYDSVMALPFCARS